MNECPKCLGIGLVFNPSENGVIECSLCKGEGIIDENICYNPLEDEEYEE